MPTPNEKQYYVELTRHSLHAVRATGPAIEFCRECPLDQKAAVEELLAAWGSGTPVRAVVALTPLQSHWHLSVGNEASRHRTDAALRTFAANLPHGFEGPLELLSCHAEDGSAVTPVGNARWLINAAPTATLETATAAVRERLIEPLRVESAILTRLAAAATAVRHAGSSPVILWHLGLEHSQLFLVTSRGVEAVASCPTGLDALFTIVQGALGLKLRGAAARLFFNDTYDFTEAGPRIAAELAPSLKTALATLPSSSASAAFACASFTGKQAWLSADVARAVGLAPWAPDVARIVSHLQLRLPADTVVTPDLLGVLHLAGSHARNLTEWHPTWTKPGAAPAAPAVASPATPAPSSAKTSAPVAEPVIKAVTVTNSPRVAELEPAGVASAATVALLPDAPRETKSAPAPKTVARPDVKPTAKVEVAPARKPEKTAPKAAAPTPPKTPATPPPAAVTPTAVPTAAPQKKRGFGLYLGVAAGLACAVFAGKFYFDAKEAQAVIEQEKEAAAQLAKAATARAQALEAQAKAEAERIRREAEQAREEAVALARQQAEQQTRVAVTAEIEAERIANSPGILIVTTSPVGAGVSIDGGPVRPSPLSLNDLMPGSHRVNITLDGYEPVELTADIAGTKTTDLGLIMLQRATGTLAITSTPENIAFAVRPAGVPGALPVRQGRTPAQFEDLPPGDYAVTFSNAGWQDQVEIVRVEKRATTNAATAFKGGAVLLTSNPAGATVIHNGEVIGITPLDLTDLPPQKVAYQLTLAGYDPIAIEGEILEGQQLKLDARLLAIDRIATASEIARAPEAYETPSPTIRAFNLPPEVKVTFVVLRDGSTGDVQVVGKVDNDLAEACIAAVRRWKFHPATNHEGRPLNVRVTLPIKIMSDVF